MENCAGCHGSDLAGDPYAPPLAGASFVSKWRGRPVSQLLDLMQLTMPQTFPGGLGRQQNADLLAFMLRQNNVPAGKREIPPQGEQLRETMLSFPAGATTAVTSVPPSPPEATAAKVAVSEDGVYTAAQAERGRGQFNKWCTACHVATSAPTRMSTTGRGFLLGSQHLIMSLGGRYAQKYPSVYHLYRRVRDTMPSFNADAVRPATKVDIVAYLLQQNGFPAGRDELKLDTTLMKRMKLQRTNEEEFETVFNGKDLTGIGILLGPNCRPQPEGCGWTTPHGIFSVQNGELVTTGKVQGYWYTPKKYLNFTLRFDYRHTRPADLDPDDEYYDGNSGYLLFVTEHLVWPRGIEIQGNNANMLSAIGMDATIKQVDDDNARKRAYRRVGEWSSVEIVSNNGQVKSYLNGVLVNTVTEHPFKEAGHIGFQSEGGELHWRNIRIKAQ